MKGPSVERQLRTALDQADFEQNQFYVPVRAVGDIVQAKRALPDARLVWFGGVETDWSEAWLKRLAMVGVHANELHWANIAAQRQNASELISAARAQGMEVGRSSLSRAPPFRPRQRALC